MKAATIRSVSFLLFVFLLILPISAAEAEASPPSLAPAGGFVLYNIENDRIILEKSLDAEIYPASSVKLMSGLIICEALQDRVGERVRLTAEMLRGSAGKPFDLKAGQELTIEHLMYAAFSGGYNDAVTALSVIAAGSLGEMLEQMNDRAVALGMSDTVFKNVTGLDASGQKTTLRDLLRLARAAAENELFLRVSSEYTYPIEFADGTTRLAYGSNELVNKNSPYYCKSVRGMNSGMTDSGGACAVTLGEYDGARYIAIAVGCPGDGSRFALIQNALDYAYKNYGYRVILPAGSVVGEADIGLAVTETEKVKLVLAEDLSVFAAEDEELGDLTFSLLLTANELNAPLSESDTLGSYSAWRGKAQLAVAKITVGHAVEQSGFLAFLDGMRGYLGGRAFIATLISLAALTALSLIIPQLALISRQKKRRYVRQRDGFKLK